MSITNEFQSNIRLTTASRIWASLRAAGNGAEDNQSMLMALQVVVDIENNLTKFAGGYDDLSEERKGALIDASTTIFEQLAREDGFGLTQSQMNEAINKSTSIAMAMSRNLDVDMVAAKDNIIFIPAGDPNSPATLQEQIKWREELRLVSSWAKATPPKP